MNFGSLIPWKGKSQVPSVTGDYVDPFVAMRREMDRMFREISNIFADGASWPEAPGWQLAPVLDISESDTEIVVSAEIPGLDEKDLDVTLAGDVLTIRGEKKAQHERKNGDAYYAERRFGSFSRSVRLPFEAGEEAVEAKYDKGVLTVRVPKPAHVRDSVRRIEVKSA